MKKFFIAALLALSSTAFSQKEGSFISLGIKTGFNSTKFRLSDLGSYTTDEWKTESKTGFIYGGYARIRFSHPFYLQPEVYFSEKRFVMANSSLTAKTFDIPILLNMRVLTLGPVRIHGLAGPVMSVVRKDRIPDDMKDYVDFKNRTWTFQAGAGIDILRFDIDARYEWGFNEATKGIGGKTDVLTITAGYRLFGH